MFQLVRNTAAQHRFVALAFACLCAPLFSTAGAPPPMGDTPNVTGEWRLMKLDIPGGPRELGTVRIYTSRQRMFLEIMQLRDDATYEWNPMGSHTTVAQVKSKLLKLAGVYRMGSEPGGEVLENYSSIKPKFMVSGLGPNPSWMPLSIEGRAWGSGVNLKVERMGNSLADLAASAQSSIGSLIGTWTVGVAGQTRDVEVFQGYTTAMVLWDGSELYELDKSGGSNTSFSGSARGGGQSATLNVTHGNEMKLAFGSTVLTMTRNGGAPPPGSAPAPSGGGAAAAPSDPGAPGDNALHMAVRQKNDSQVRALVSAKQVPIDALSSSGQTALHEAVLVGDDLVMEELLTGGANANAVNNKGQTPVELALQLDKLSLAKMLLKRGAEVKGATAAVEKAVQTKNTEVLDLLLKAGADANVAVNKAIETGNREIFISVVDGYSVSVSNALFQKAIDGNRLPIAEAILDRGIDENAALSYCLQKGEKNMVPIILSRGKAAPGPALEHAVRSNDQVLAELVIDTYRGDPNAVLGIAVEANNLTMVNFLLSKRADPNLQMEQASRKGYDGIVGALLKAQADPNKGMQPAVEARMLSTIKLLVENGAKPNPAMPLAAEVGDQPLVELLLSNGANPELGMPIAVDKGNAALAGVLIAARADGSKPEYLHKAAGSGNMALATVLVDQGRADAQEGMLPAIRSHHNEMVFMLMQRGASGNRSGYLAAAAVHNDVALTSKLIEAGCAPVEALEPAVGAGAGAVVNQLVDLGVDVKATALLVTAVEKDYFDVTAALLRGGADPMGYVNPSSGWTLLHTASHNSNASIIKAMIDKGLDVNAVVGGSGDTPLLLAVRHGNKALMAVMALVEAGANVNAMNTKGKSVLQETPTGIGGGGKVRDYLKDKGADRKPGK